MHFYTGDDTIQTRVCIVLYLVQKCTEHKLYLPLKSKDLVRKIEESRSEQIERIDIHQPLVYCY